MSRKRAAGKIYDSDRSVAAREPACLQLDDGVDAVRSGRRFVEQQVAARGAAALADDAALVAGELLANACQHGLAPITICVMGGPDRLRIEVRDSSTRSPVRPSHSLSNMTGRGLALVEAVAARWGVERAPGGKSVWVELDAAKAATFADHGDVDAMLMAWHHDDEPGAEPRFTVVLGDVPTDLLVEAKTHIDNLVREFFLASVASETRQVTVPEHLARLIETVVHGFSDARDAIKRQALAATRRGETRTRLTLHLPASAADAGEAYLAALDKADEYSRAARLLTLETPPDHRLFRRWYVEAVVRQLRQLSVGQTPEPVLGFDQVLVSEVRRLSVSQRVSERAARLQRVTAALARARTPEDVAAVVISEGVEALGASGGGMLVPARDGQHLAVPGVVGYGAELVDALREERIDEPLPGATALRTGEAVWLESQEARDRSFPTLRGFEASTISMCAVPLSVGERTLGALRFSFDVPKLFDDQERSFVLALAAQTAQTLQRTELYEAERRAALELQRALLSDDVPVIPGWDVATHSSPAGDQQAGGDFYDVLPVPGGRIVAVVGDVMGRGVEAAAAMAQVRSTIRAYAIDDPDPVSVFRRVDTYFEALNLEQLVTVIYILVEPGSDDVHIASAGHLPPLLVDGSGSRIITTANDMPFGVGIAERSAVTVTLPSGTALVAVTDGLVERRGEDIDEGVDRLVRVTEHSGGWSAQALLSHIVARSAAEGTYDDDVTVLVLRRR